MYFIIVVISGLVFIIPGLLVPTIITLNAYLVIQAINAVITISMLIYTDNKFVKLKKGK